MSEKQFSESCFNRSFTFRFGDCDVRKNASIYAIMKLFSEAAGDDYESRRLGHGVLWEHGQAFIISRLAIEFQSLPVFGEEIVLRTWEREVKGPFFYRDFEITDKNGAPMAAGTSQWLLVNPHTHEILRPSVLYGGLFEGKSTFAACHPCKKLRMPAEYDVLGQRTIYYSDLDSNNHVNNAVYGRIATDFLPEEYRSRSLRGLDISFNLETRLGETLELRGAETSEGYMVLGVVGDAMHFACELQFNI